MLPPEPGVRLARSRVNSLHVTRRCWASPAGRAEPGADLLQPRAAAVLAVLAGAAPAAAAASAEFSQTKAWVSTALSTAASACTEQRTRIRGIASPASATPNPSSNSEAATSNGRQL